MSAVKIPVGFALLAMGIPGALSAIELQRDTLTAWNDYVWKADSTMQARLDGRRPFLWIDEASGRRGALGPASGAVRS